MRHKCLTRRFSSLRAAEVHYNRCGNWRYRFCLPRFRGAAVMFGLFRALLLSILTLSLASCGSIPYEQVGLGRLHGRVMVMWVGYDDFVYIPSPALPFAFETAISGKPIQPGLMYTDGGSLPRIAQIFNGFSPWGFGPAYAIHDWIFFARHCRIDGKDGPWFDDVRNISLDDAAFILAEVIKTLIDYGQVRNNAFAGNVISNAVDSTIAAAFWNQPNACRRVSPWHIAVAWVAVVGRDRNPPASWKLSPEEINQARKRLRDVPDTIAFDTPARDKTGMSEKNPVVAPAAPPVVVPATPQGPRTGT